MKHYKSIKILSKISDCQVALHKFKPVSKTFCWRRFCFLNLTSLSCDSLVAFDSYQYEKVRNTRTVNLQPFGCVLRDVFSSCVWQFYSRRGMRAATWSSYCALKSLCRHRYCIDTVSLFFCFDFFFWTQDGKKWCDSNKKRRPCVLSTISIVAISVGLPVAVNKILFLPAK